MTKKRPASVAQSPMTRMTQEFGDALDESERFSSTPADNLPTSQTYCTPEYFSGDFCTPDDQVQETNYSQRDRAPEPSSKGYVCPPTPESTKRRKTRPPPTRSEFLYDLDSLPEEQGKEEEEAPMLPPQQRTPGKRSLAPAKPQKQMKLQEAWSWQQGASTSSASSSKGRTVGAKACNTNPFVNDLTEKEQRTPSRAVPVLEASGRPSRYLQDFEELEFLGKGDFGQVYKVRSRIDGCLYAVKRGKLAPRSSGNKSSAYYEVFAMAAMAGVCNAVRYHAAWVEDEELHIQMELCQGTLAKQAKGRLSEEAALEVLEQIATALEGMHSMGMAHMDIKADNIYVAVGGGYRLGDFGLAASEELQTKGFEAMEGDGRYAAPEAIMGLSQGMCRLTPCDVYSLGACVLELCLGLPLEWSSHPYQGVREGRPVEVPGFDARTCMLLADMLALDPDERTTAASVRAMAQSIRGTGSEEEKLRAELSREQGRRAELEARLAALAGTPNQSVDRVNDSMEGSEPTGSQESPFRSSAQPVPPSPIPRQRRRSSRGKNTFFSSLPPPSPSSAMSTSPCAASGPGARRY